jgi:hypothetical protein
MTDKSNGRAERTNWKFGAQQFIMRSWRDTAFRRPETKIDTILIEIKADIPS